MENNNLDTKAKIFNTALNLFAANGYENVSIRTIADAVGIKTASIYYHYSNKEEILNSCYEFYVENRHGTRLTKEEYVPVITCGTKEEILDALQYTFPDDILMNMISALLVIFSRIYTDPKAKQIYVDEVNSSMQYLIDFFSTGIELGRFKDFNIPAVSLIFFSSRIFVAQSLTIEPEDKVKWSHAEDDIFNELMNIIPFDY